MSILEGIVALLFVAIALMISVFFIHIFVCCEYVNIKILKYSAIAAILITVLVGVVYFKVY